MQLQLAVFCCCLNRSKPQRQSIWSSMSVATIAGPRVEQQYLGIFQLPLRRRTHWRHHRDRGQKGPRLCLFLFSCCCFSCRSVHWESVPLLARYPVLIIDKSKSKSKSNVQIQVQKPPISYKEVMHKLLRDEILFEYFCHNLALPSPQHLDKTQTDAHSYSCIKHPYAIPRANREPWWI